MNQQSDQHKLFTELDHRENDGIEVSLLWSRCDNSLAVLVIDTKRDEMFELPVQGDEALDVFRHPYAYAASRRADDNLQRTAAPTA